MAQHRYAWQPRRKSETTPEYLGRALDGLGLEHVAARARAGAFDDLEPHSIIEGNCRNIHLLVGELMWIGASRSTVNPALSHVIWAAMTGEFDATQKEWVDAGVDVGDPAPWPEAYRAACFADFLRSLEETRPALSSRPAP